MEDQNYPFSWLIHRFHWEMGKTPTREKGSGDDQNVPQIPKVEPHHLLCILFFHLTMNSAASDSPFPFLLLFIFDKFYI